MQAWEQNDFKLLFQQEFFDVNIGPTDSEFTVLQFQSCVGQYFYLHPHPPEKSLRTGIFFSDEYNNNDRLKYSEDLAFLRGLSSDQESYLYGGQPQQVKFKFGPRK